MSECMRCGRELKNPNDLFGWRCAEILGINNTENLSESDIDKLVDWYLQNSVSLSYMGDGLTNMGIANINPYISPYIKIQSDTKGSYLFSQAGERLFSVDLHPLSKELLTKNNLPKSIRKQKNSAH